jgi:RNA polymerase sigma factor (sigma-70 family)
LLFRFYYPGLVSFVSQIISDRDEAEEIVQDFFVNLWTSRKSIHQSTSLKSYFFVSVKNRAFNYLKKEQIKEKTLNQLKELVEKDILFQPDLFVESELTAANCKGHGKTPGPYPRGFYDEQVQRNLKRRNCHTTRTFETNRGNTNLKCAENSA